MEAEKCQITINRTDDGFQVNIKGNMFKEGFACGCAEVPKASKSEGSDCCGSEEKNQDKPKEE